MVTSPNLSSGKFFGKSYCAGLKIFPCNFASKQVSFKTPTAILGGFNMEKRAIIIEDEPVSRLILSHLLTSLDWNVTAFEDAESALGRLHEGPVELACVDWNLPQASGIDFIKAAKSHPGQSEMKIMMITAETGMEQVHQALQSGADEYLMKPHNLEMVLGKLQMLGFEST
jgi:two-component system chemotaxis response regulator CheY